MERVASKSEDSSLPPIAAPPPVAASPTVAALVTKRDPSSPEAGITSPERAASANVSMTRGGAEIDVSSLDICLDGRQLFQGFDLSIRKGEFVVVAGPSGCGKTTLLHCLAGFSNPTSGTIIRRIDDKILHPGAVGADIGFVYQHLRLAKAITALNAVCCGRLSRYPFWKTALGFSAQDREEAWSELKAVGLGNCAHTPVGRLSGGERQRVALARTLHQQPAIYFVDEPVANLDRANAQLVLSRLHRETRQAGRTVVAVLHDETQIGLFADRVLRWQGPRPGTWKIEVFRQ